MKSKSKITKNIDWRLSSTGKPSKALINLLSSGNRILEKKEFDEMKKPGSPYNKVAKELSQKRKIWRKKVIDSFSKKKFRDSITIRRYMYDTTTGNGHLYDISKLIGEKLGQKDAALLMRVAKVIRPKKKKTVKPKKKKTVKKTKSFKKKFEELEDELEDAYQKGNQDIIEEIEKDLKKLVKKKKTSKTKK